MLTLLRQHAESEFLSMVDSRFPPPGAARGLNRHTVSPRSHDFDLLVDSGSLDVTDF